MTISLLSSWLCQLIKLSNQSAPADIEVFMKISNEVYRRFFKDKFKVLFCMGVLCSDAFQSHFCLEY